jgi:4-carboxymuconolactone decarboxylase
MRSGAQGSPLVLRSALRRRQRDHGVREMVVWQVVWQMESRDVTLRRLTLGDEAYLERLVGTWNEGGGALDGRSIALLRLGALAATDGADILWHHIVAQAFAAGVTSDEIVEALIALAPILGTARVITVAPKLSLAAGYDVESALEDISR